MSLLFASLIILGVIIIIAIHYDFYRRVKLLFKTVSALENTRSRLASQRTVALITLNDGEELDSYTVKSLLDQSIRPHEISVETSAKRKPPDTAFVKFHPKNTLQVREDDSSNLILRVNNGRYYDFDYVERASTI